MNRPLALLLAVLSTAAIVTILAFLAGALNAWLDWDNDDGPPR